MHAHQLPTTTQDNLAEVLKPGFEFTEHLLGVAVGSILDGSSILAGAGHQHITLLLGVLTKLDGFLMEAFSLCLAVALNTQALLTDGFQLLESLLPDPLVLLHQLAGAIHRFSLQLCAALLGLLFKLLTTGSKGLIHLRQTPLMFLFRLGRLSAGLGLELFSMETGLLTNICGLALCLLANGRCGDQLFPFPSCLGHDLLSLLLGLLDEAFPLPQKLIGLGNLEGEGLSEGIHRLDGVLLIDQSSSTEGDTAAVENDLFKLIELVENRDARLGHVNG